MRKKDQPKEQHFYPFTFLLNIIKFIFDKNKIQKTNTKNKFLEQKFVRTNNSFRKRKNAQTLAVVQRFSVFVSQ